jgi:hypothetical protein
MFAAARAPKHNLDRQYDAIARFRNFAARDAIE